MHCLGRNHPQHDMTWAIPIFVVLGIALLWLNIQMGIAVWCVRKRQKGKRAWNWLEVIAGYDKEQRSRK